MAKDATLERLIEGQLFHCGRVTTSAAAVYAAADASFDLEMLLRRHAQGNTGPVTPDQAVRNRVALTTAGTVVSAHRSRLLTSPLVFIIETDIANRQTRILLQPEYEQEPPREPPHPAVQEFLDKEVALRTQRDQIAAAIPRAELEQARTVEAEASSQLDALVVEEATGQVASAQVKAAERKFEAASAQSATLSRKVDTLEARSLALDRQIEETARARKHTEEAVAQAHRKALSQLVDLIDRHEKDAQRVRVPPSSFEGCWRAWSTAPRSWRSAALGSTLRFSLAAVRHSSTWRAVSRQTWET